MLKDDIPFWIECPANGIPEGALKGGYNGKETLFIGRAKHMRALTPGSVVGSMHKLFLAWGFKAHEYADFEILIGDCTDNWVCSKSGEIPKNGFPGGYTQNGETLYIGRVRHDNKLLVGKIHPSYKTCYIPYNGKELEFSEYEVFVV